MTSNGNFVQIRRGILQHVKDGRLSPNSFAVYMTIILLADASTGMWRGSAPALVVHFNGSLSLDAIQRALNSLEENGYIKRFRTHGQRGNYPILVNKYLITSGRLKNGTVNAELTVDWRQPVTDVATDTATEVGTDTATYSIRQDVKTARQQDLQNRSKLAHTAPQVAHAARPEHKTETVPISAQSGSASDLTPVPPAPLPHDPRNCIKNIFNSCVECYQLAQAKRRAARTGATMPTPTPNTNLSPVQLR